MKSSVYKVPALLAVSSLFLLSACGGGGGGGSGSGATQASSTITTANSSDVAAQAYWSSTALNEQVSSSGSLITGVSIQTKTTGLIDASVQHLYRALHVKPAGMVVGVSGSYSEPCTGGGTISVAYNVTDQNFLTAGDTLSISSSNCVENQLTLNGNLSITFNSVTGTPSPSSAWGATMALRFNNFAVTENGVTDMANGDMAVSFNQTTATSQSFSATGNSLQLTTASSSGSTSRTLSAYSYTGSVTDTGLYTSRTDLNVSGNLPRLGSNVMYAVKTLSDFKQQGTLDPYTGVLTVKATDNTSLTLTVLNSTSVQIGVDKDGNGTIDETITKTWAELHSLL